MLGKGYKGDANLGRILLFTPKNALCCELDIGVSRVNEHRRFATKFQRQGSDILGSGSGDDSTNRATSGEKDVVPLELKEGRSLRDGAVHNAVGAVIMAVLVGFCSGACMFTHRRLIGI